MLLILPNPGEFKTGQVIDLMDRLMYLVSIYGCQLHL